jgi:N-acyl-D-aspartate/D-glutamate deacylase
MKFDLLIKNGSVLDGTGAEAAQKRKLKNQAIPANLPV